ncbi:hypothetical protein [uncultured Nocardioides sp.]|uniref:hypothetical protein n=1 Tax=uncultured Nocardioides sp. TaxID=198441 RepID=UPI002604A9F0|nr:hypothetical protein [uncultured Nocardioides sp.]
MPPPYDDRAERLAAWLEGLGLDEQLADAGLPTFERDAGGVARWTDPVTGEPLSGDQLADLDGLLHQEGDDPGHAVPVTLVQLRRRAGLRDGLLADGWHSYASLGELRGTSEDATRFAVHKAANRGALLVVPHRSTSIVPAFQLTDDGELRPELGPVLEPLLTARMDPWAAWAWLARPVALLSGTVPEVAARDPEEALIVRHAALRLAERVRRTA